MEINQMSLHSEQLRYFKLPSFYKIRQICASEIPLQAFHIKLGHTLIDGR